MQISNEIQQLLDELGLEHVETILDRRGTLALRVSQKGKHLVLKLQSEDGSEESSHKAKLLVREGKILSCIPHLTNRLYVGHGENGGRHWLLIREIEGQEVHQVAKRVRETISDKKERIAELIKLVLRVSAFYDALYAGGYLHGDVQAAHTYLEHGEITVIDWGLARKVDEPNPLYKGGFIYFVAPEIAASMRADEKTINYTTHAEVYALGATLYMFYAGHLGLDFGIAKENLRQAPMDQKLARVMENRIFSFKEIGADPYPALEALLRKSLSTDPEQRFENPSALHQHLSELGSL